MKKIALAGLILVAVTLTLTPLSEARPHRPSHRPVVHTRVVIGFGPAVYWGPYPYPYWYYPPPPYAVYAPPPVIIQEAPPVYIQQTPPPAAAPRSVPTAAPVTVLRVETSVGVAPVCCPAHWRPP